METNGALIDGLIRDLATYESAVRAVVAILGAVVGSFLNVCIYRLPRRIFWQHSRSVCPSCRRKIPFYLNIPIVSYLMLRGRCLACRAPIPKSYPVVELGTAIGFVAIYAQFPFSPEPGVLYAPDLLRFIHATAFTSLVVVCALIDAQHMIIPDAVSLPMIALSPVVAWLHPELTLVSSLSGVVIGAGILYVFQWIYWLIRRVAGFGFGDVKLLAAIGGWLGLEAIVPTLLYGSVLGSVVGLTLIATAQGHWQSRMPFGPFLVIGSLLHFFYGQELLENLARLQG